jgi:uncharacterized membrane protein YcjF (UPF0283 family)
MLVGLIAAVVVLFLMIRYTQQELKAMYRLFKRERQHTRDVEECLFQITRVDSTEEIVKRNRSKLASLLYDEE